MRHNEIQDLEAKWLSEVCKDVAVEPSLQPITGELLDLATANSADNARLDIKARGFYRQGQVAFFDARVSNVKAESNINLATETILRRAENEKRELTTDG